MAPEPLPRDGADDGLDPAAFLKSVRELSEKREREDEERYRKLEEEVERSRAARAARRADRARSISPEKQQHPTSIPSTPLNTSASNRVRSPEHRSPSPFVNTPQSLATTPMAADTADGPPSPTKHIPEFAGFRSSKSSLASMTSPAKSPSPDLERSPSRSATSLARSGTLSWQQRPSSMASSRPASVSQTSRSSRDIGQDSLVDRPEPSRDQIAASLGARDPTWFRQTADRGIGNAAFRRSREQEAEPVKSDTLRRHGLPGLSREVSTETDSPARSGSLRSETSTRQSSLRDSTFTSTRFSGSSTSASTPQRPDLSALVAADEAQQQASPMSETTPSSDRDRNSDMLSRTPTMSTTQVRMSATPDRPLSPTKGMGGFVQSAMLRRSDSVNKRWSAQPNAAQLSRQNSAASSRTGLPGTQSMPKLDPGFTERSESSTVAAHDPLIRSPSTNDGFVKPAMPYHSRNRSMASNYGDDGISSPPSGSPKRWSPTKSSWIESALTKPETQKAVTPAKNSQPSWMADIAKAKAQRASTELPSRPTTPQSSREQFSRPGSPLKSPIYTENSFTAQPLATSRTASPTREPPTEVADATKAGADDEPLQNKTPLNGPQESPLKSQTSTPKLSSTYEQTRSVSPVLEKPKLDVSQKPATTDFRSVLKSRPAAPAKEDSAPEFLSKFGHLRKTTTEKYVAPDVLKENITRGKADLAKTDGPVKTPRRDELKESLLAKKEDIKKAKEEGKDLPGQAHDRKAGPPLAPSKPEALAKRELLGRAGSTAKSPTHEQGAREGTPEAVLIQRHMRAKSVSAKDSPKPVESEPGKTATSPSEDAASDDTQTSKLAARFNPALAQMLARGPPSAVSSNAPSRVTSPDAGIVENGTKDDTLQDMRKGRAKGPARRKREATTSEPSTEELPAERQRENGNSTPSTSRTTPKRGSTASVMMASLGQTSRNTSINSASSFEEPVAEAQRPARMSKSPPAQGSVASVMWASLGAKPNQKSQEDSVEQEVPSVAESKGESNVAVPEFQGFRKSSSTRTSEDNKENDGNATPTTSRWSRNTPVATPKIQLPSQKDEEAIMRSAGLLASSPSRTTPSKGLPNGKSNESASAPPRPAKSSRVVSGQLQEASPNKGFSSLDLTTHAESFLIDAFGSKPDFSGPLTIDVSAVYSNVHSLPSADVSPGRKTVQEVNADGTARVLPPQEEYTLYDEAVYICQQYPSASAGSRKPQLFIWSGVAASNASQDHAQVMSRKLAREVGAAGTHEIAQGRETPGFLHAMGGILVTRRGAREGASKRYMLCGRKHLGHVVFDEVDFDHGLLCPGYVFLVSQPVTLQQTKLYLWKGSACAFEEISGARLASMDLSETGEIIEVEGGAEFSSFLRVFGDDVRKADLPESNPFWQQKALAPSKFGVRLFKLQQQQAKMNLITSLWSRRPSWNSLSPSRTGSPAPAMDDIKTEAQIVQPFAQEDLDADSIYVLDAWSEIHVILGPLFGSQSDPLRSKLLSQSLLFAEEYASLAAQQEERPSLPEANVLFSGTPPIYKWLFRQWDDGRGLWATSELLSGSRSGEARMVFCGEVLLALNRTNE